MRSMTLHTPLRYPGGKRKLSDFFERLLSDNGLLGGDYAEPFAGGAGLALELLKRGAVRHVYLNDIDPHIFAFWNAILDRTEDFCQLIEETPVTIQEWHKQKEILSDSSADTLLHGFATFFLNRTNRSGILLGGVIGGKNQTGKWKLDCRFNKTDLSRKIKSIGAARDSISFFNDNAEDFLRNVCSSFSNKSLIYLDPPYYTKGACLYKNHYKHGDHERLAEQVKKIGTPWVVSYDNQPEISLMYRDKQKIEYSICYSAQKHTAGNEIIFCGNCTFPQKKILPRN